MSSRSMVSYVGLFSLMSRYTPHRFLLASPMSRYTRHQFFHWQVLCRPFQSYIEAHPTSVFTSKSYVHLCSSMSRYTRHQFFTGKSYVEVPPTSVFYWQVLCRPLQSYVEVHPTSVFTSKSYVHLCSPMSRYNRHQIFTGKSYVEVDSIFFIQFVFNINERSGNV
ncbi:hypothetical protein AVEN_242297-1 [Araneus ventricosus]|uniref:Uncharacterized protein n=1 Tax=Araneus ventricosus TaxID=182803 RepID=A0A4Y2TH15_ARAVE|nr:hypothetical protein AVEN_242297-1 [Araneus ventricosus]